MTDNQDELVERLARTLCGLDGGPPFEERSVDKRARRAAGITLYDSQDEILDSARILLDTLRPGDTYNGMMWVPVEPTDAMIQRACQAMNVDLAEVVWVSEEDAADAYRAMIQATKGDE